MSCNGASRLASQFREWKCREGYSRPAARRNEQTTRARRFPSTPGQPANALYGVNLADADGTEEKPSTSPLSAKRTIPAFSSSKFPLETRGKTFRNEAVLQRRPPAPSEAQKQECEQMLGPRRLDRENPPSSRPAAHLSQIEEPFCETKPFVPGSIVNSSGLWVYSERRGAARPERVSRDHPPDAGRARLSGTAQTATMRWIQDPPTGPMRDRTLAPRAREWREAPCTQSDP